MSRPEAGSEGVGHRTIVACAMLALAAPGSLEAAIAATHEEPAAVVDAGLASPNVAVGASATAGTRLAQDQAVRLAGRLGEAFGPEQRAEELYLDAMEKLGAGHQDRARSTFESLIARFPDTPSAARARARLIDLEPVVAPAPAPAPRPVVAPAASAAPRAVERSPAWEQELRRNAVIQSKLRTEAGDRVFFSAGAAALGTRALAALAAQAQWLKRWREFEAVIVGHADESGTTTDNLRLSQERAEAVRLRLVQEGVEPSRLAVVGFGRAERISVCADPGCAAQNRRAVTTVFAAGTRSRLGLEAPVQSPDVVGAAAPQAAPVGEPAAPPAAERVGVAR